MKKSFKRILASAMAVVSLTMGVTGMSANAATPVSQSGTTYGTLTGYINVYGNTTVEFKTTTTQSAYDIRVNGSIVHYYSGEAFRSGSNQRYYSSSVSKSFSWPFYVGTEVSAFGSHEAYTESGAGWVVYTSLIDFYI